MKVDIIDYSDRAIAIVATSKTEQILLSAHGVFNTNLKNGEGTRAGWIFSAKRRDEVEKIAKKLKCPVVDYNPGRSIALFPALETHQAELMKVASFNPRLTDAEGNHFAGWVASKKRQDKIVELAKSF